MLKAGDILSNRYEIESVLGKGGMGAVYLARDLRIPCKWAIKELSSKLSDAAQQAQAQEMFKAEAHILSSLRHQHLPRITDYFSENGNQYLVMDFIEGTTLEDILKRTPQLPIETVLDYAFQWVDVLQYLHNQPTPIIFRDFKPANIMVTPEGQTKLIDFGIARFFRDGASKDTQAFGTPGYAAPEQYGRGQSDVRTDIYGLAATIHQALTGCDPTTQPFNFDPIRNHRPEVPVALENIITKALNIDPNQRYQTIEEIKAALEQLRSDPQAYRYLPERLKTGILPPPRDLGFSPSSLTIGPVKRGKTITRELTLRGSLKAKLKSNARWLKVTPKQVDGTDTKVTLTIRTSSLVDGGTFTGTVTASSTPPIPPLEVKLEVTPNHVTGWTLALAFLLCLTAIIPIIGYGCTFLLIIMYISVPKGERTLLRVFVALAMACSIGWTLIFALIGFGLAQIPWHELQLPSFHL